MTYSQKVVLCTLGVEATEEKIDKIINARIVELIEKYGRDTTKNMFIDRVLSAGDYR